MSREERLRKTCAALVELTLAMGAELHTAHTVAGVFAKGVEREWGKRLVAMEEEEESE